MASDDRVELVIEGLPEHDGRVRLNVFMSQLQSLGAILSLLDRESNEGRAGSMFEIAGLSYSSPVRVVLEPKQLSAQPYTGGAVVARLGTSRTLWGRTRTSPALTPTCSKASER
jgi:hypothetical protein